MKDKTCLVCGSNKPNKKGDLDFGWIKENQFRGKHGQILKEVYIGRAIENKTEREIINVVYYCSLSCMEKQQDQEEAEDWKKGECKTCGLDLIVVNRQGCEDEEHKKEAHLFPIDTPECMKPKRENCWKDTEKWLEEVFAKGETERKEIIKNLRADLTLKGVDCSDCKDRTLKKLDEWEKNRK